MKDALAEKGYDLDIVVYDDYVLPNKALADGDLDANYFQHTPYLNSYNASNGTDLVAAAKIHYEPFGRMATAWPAWPTSSRHHHPDPRPTTATRPRPAAAGSGGPDRPA